MINESEWRVMAPNSDVELACQFLIIRVLRLIRGSSLLVSRISPPEKKIAIPRGMVVSVTHFWRGGCAGSVFQSSSPEF